MKLRVQAELTVSEMSKGKMVWSGVHPLPTLSFSISEPPKIVIYYSMKSLSYMIMSTLVDCSHFSNILASSSYHWDQLKKQVTNIL